MNGLLPVARVSKLFGVNGELAINLFDTLPDNIELKEPWFVVIDGLTVPLFLESFERRGRRGATVRFADLDSGRRCLELIGRELLMRCGEPQEPTDDDELSPEQLVGFRAILSGKLEGEITGYLESELNPLFTVTVAGGEILIPVADEMIDHIDMDTKTVVFCLPEGLIDLYL